MLNKPNLTLITFIVSVSLMVFSYILENQEKFGLCDNSYTTSDYTGCLDMAGSEYGDLLALIGIVLLVVSPFLAIMHQRVVERWMKVSVVILPIFIIAVEFSSSRTGFSVIPSTQEILLVFLGGVYILGTVIFIVYGIYKKRKETRW